MLLRQNKKLEDVVVDFLAETPAQETQDIFAHARGMGLQCSERAVYKAVRQLENDGIVIRQKRLLSLNLPWILKLMSFAERAYERYLDSKAVENLIPQPEKSLSFSFSSLKQLDTFCAQASVG